MDTTTHVAPPDPSPEQQRIKELEVRIKELIGELGKPPLRRCLSETRSAVTHKFDIAGHEGYLTVGLFEEGTPGELFITMAKEGSTIGGLLDTIATFTSLALQYGIPLEVLVKKFARRSFEPSGFTKNPDMPNASSIVDYVFRWMATQFVPGHSENIIGAHNQLELVIASLQDAPTCPNCGHVAVRNGVFYKCPNCGESLGCS